MKLKVTFYQDSVVPVNLLQEDATFRMGYGEVQTSTELVNDYEKLENLPSINGVLIIGNKTAQDLNIETKYPEEGNIGDILMKTTNANNGVSWITPASKAEENNTRPITAAAVYTEIGNINVLLATI